MVCKMCGREVVIWKNIRLSPDKRILCSLCGKITSLMGGTGIPEDDEKLTSKIIRELTIESDIEE